MSKTPYVIGNLAYGPRYTDVFLNQHLKACLDESNLPNITGTHEIHYEIFTDPETAPMIMEHKNVKRLRELGEVNLQMLSWPDPEVAYHFRYTAIITMFRHLCQKALNLNGVFTQFAADIIPAKYFFILITEKVRDGYDSVLGLPLRAAYEPMEDYLNSTTGALYAMDLARYAYSNLHPLWTHSHWHNPQFSKLPFCLVWNSGTGLLVRSFSISPFLMTPNEQMLKSQKVMDAEIPTLCKNPFWARDWTSCPVIEAGFLFSYYPPFEQKPASVPSMIEFGKKISREQHAFITERFYYPNQEMANIPPEMSQESSEVVSAIAMGLVPEKQAW